MIRKINGKNIRTPGIGADGSATNSTTETVVGNMAVSASELQVGDVCRIRGVFRKATTNSTLFDVKLYWNTSSSLVGAVQLGTYSVGGTESSPSFQRTFVIKATDSIDIYSFSGSTNTSFFGASNIPGSTVSGLDFTSTSYFIFTATRTTVIGRAFDSILLSNITLEV